MWTEIRAGRINTIGTDHCSYTRQEKKELGLPGFPGVEELLSLMVTFGVQAGRISWIDLIRLLSAGPASVLGLYPRKGCLQVGSDADVVIFDLNQERQFNAPTLGRGDFSPYTGLRLAGKVVSTFVRGHEVFSNGTINPATVGWGIWQDRGFS
jgi:dihydropyrimidinase